MADFEEIRILYEGIKKMFKSQTERSINNFVASMSSLIHCFAAIAGSIGGKTNMDITRLLVEKSFASILSLKVTIQIIHLKVIHTPH